MFSFQTMKQDSEKLLEAFGSDLSTVRTGRARPSLVENVPVEAYGSMMKILELANISAPDPGMILIKPWDSSVIQAIAKAIQISDLHLNPVVDGQQIRLVIPPLTGERREELIKLVLQKKHSYDEMLRDIRTKYKKQVESQEGNPGISEDDIKHDLEALQKVTDEYAKRLQDMTTAKERELRE